MKTRQRRWAGAEPGDLLSLCSREPQPLAGGLGEMLWPPSCASVVGQLLALCGFTWLLLGAGLEFLAERFWFPNQID